MAVTRAGRKQQRKRAPMRRYRGRNRGAAQRRRVAGTATRTFTEVLDAGEINSNAGGTFKVQFDSIPQYQEYSKLYRQFCIKKLQVMLLPLYTDAEINTGLGTLNYQATRIAWAVNDTPQLTTPGSELDVLEDNGAKVVLGHKKINISCWPKPDLTMVSPGVLTNTYVGVRQRKAVWLNTDSPGQAYSGVDISHGGISYWVSNNLANMPVPVFKVYYKVTFSMRDPA